jgi:hypothetical protein
VNQTVLEYTKLLSRAFNGAIEVNGTRIVAHPSGTLIARTSPTPLPCRGAEAAQIAAAREEALDPETDWTNV